MAEPSSRRLRWYQFRLRSLLLVTTLLASVLGGWGIVVAPRVTSYRRQQATIELSERLGGRYEATPAPDWLRRLTGEDFMKVLLKQLQFQDPLKPMDNQQMVQQMATIRELEMNTRLSQKLEQLTDQQRFAGAAALMGKRVQGTLTDDAGNEYQTAGVVKTIRFTDKGEIILDLDSGQSLPLATSVHVRRLPNAS